MLNSTAILEKQSPQLCFLLHFLRGKPWTLCQEGKNGERGGLFLHREEQIQEEISAVFRKIQLEKLEVLYIYGIGLGHYATALFDWLNEDTKRDLVFLEDDIEVFRLFLSTDLAQQLIEHSQIHFRFMLDGKNWKRFLEERANEFPYDKIEFIALESYQKKNPKKIVNMRLHLLRQTTIHDAVHKDGMYYHILSKNVLENFSRIHTAFYVNRFEGAFKGLPAVICGAGPSLKNELEVLRTLENRALIFAGGSAITGLSRDAILPHFGVAIDPNFEEVDRFRKSYAFEVPLLYTNRLHPEVFTTFNGPHGYIHAKTGGPLEQWWEKELGIEPLPLKEGFDLEAFSVTTTCLEIATTMGCNPIYLVGVDLAFTGNELYARGIVKDSLVSIATYEAEVRASERLLKRKDQNGNLVYTLVKWVMEAEAISRFVEKNSQTTYINSTSGGIGFPKMDYQSLAEQKFDKSGDLRGKIHQLIEISRFKCKVKNPLSKLTTSLKQAKNITIYALQELEYLKDKEVEPENGRMIFFQMELEELLVYQLCLEPPASTFHKTFNRMNRFDSLDTPYNKKWKWLYAKWRGFNDLITYYLDSSFTK